MAENEGAVYDESLLAHFNRKPLDWYRYKVRKIEMGDGHPLEPGLFMTQQFVRGRFASRLQDRFLGLFMFSEDQGYDPIEGRLYHLHTEQGGKIDLRTFDYLLFRRVQAEGAPWLREFEKLSVVHLLETVPDRRRISAHVYDPRGQRSRRVFGGFLQRGCIETMAEWLKLENFSLTHDFRIEV